MPTCVAFGCTKRSENSNKSTGISFHRFPVNRLRKLQWMKAIRRADWEPSQYSTVCSIHFKPEDYISYSSQNKKLLKNAVPSIFPEHNQKKVKNNMIERRKKIKKTQTVKEEIIDDVTVNENGDPVHTDISEKAMMTVSSLFYPEPSTSSLEKEIISNASDLNTDINCIISEGEIIQRQPCTEVNKKKLSDPIMARLITESVMNVAENEDPVHTAISEETMNVDPETVPILPTSSNSSEKGTLSVISTASNSLTNTNSSNSEREIIQIPSSETNPKRFSDPIMVSKEIVLQPESTSAALDPNLISALNAFRQARKSIVPTGLANRTKLSFFVIQPKTSDVGCVSLPDVNVGSTSTPSVESPRIQQAETLSAVNIGLSQDLNSMSSIFKDYDKKLEKYRGKIKLQQQTIRRQKCKILAQKKIINELSTYKFSHKMEDVDGSEEIHRDPPTTIIKLTRDG